MRFIKKNKQSGLSLIEIIIALGIFSIIMVGLVSLASLAYLNESSKRDLAFLENFIKEGESAVKSIADSGWNNLVFQQTGVEFNGES